MILFEKKYQTFDTVFHHQMKHLEGRQKYSAARRIFNSLLGVSSGDETLHLMFDILHQKSLGITKIHELSRSQHSLPCRVLSACHAILPNVGQKVWRTPKNVCMGDWITILLNSKLGPVLILFYILWLSVPKKRRKMAYVHTNLHKPSSLVMMAVEPISWEKRRPLKFKIIFKTKNNFFSEEKKCSKHDLPHHTHCYNVAGQGTTQWYRRRRGRSKKIENQKDLMQIK